MICTSIQNKTYSQILEILDRPEIEMAEIRLDLCTLSDEEIEDIFASSDIPLIATCRSSESAQAEPKPSTGLKQQPDTDPESQPNTDSEPQPSINPRQQPNTDSEPQPSTDPNSNPQTQTASLQAASESQANPQAEAQTQPQSKAIPESEAMRRLSIAIEAGARFADLEIEASAAASKTFQKLCRESGTEIIRSYHNFSETPSDEVLQMALARCFRYGADIAKIVCTTKSEADIRRIEALYTIVLEDIPSLQGRLVAFGMGEQASQTRIECLKRGAPFSYAALSSEEATAPGQLSSARMSQKIYGGTHSYHIQAKQMPASKSFAQRAILAASLAQGTSRLSGYSPCGDTLSAIALARSLGATIDINADTLTITGISSGIQSGSQSGIQSNTSSKSLSSAQSITQTKPQNGNSRSTTQTDITEAYVGESGLLTRLSIPILAAINESDFTLNGSGTLPSRPLESAADIMAAFGVLLSSDHIPTQVKGRLIPGTANVPGRGGSQLISGLLMALPLCAEDSTLTVSDPKSIPYMYMTLDVIKHFGINTRSEMEGDAELLEGNDWSACSAIRFNIRGGQSYKPANFAIEGDWSAAAVYLVAGAIFGSAQLTGLDMQSIQADITIVDILVEAGAVVSQMEDGAICARKAPLEAFTQDLNNAPDLFPITSILAAFCSGESRLDGVGRLAGKESNRAAAILEMLTQMGVEARIEGDSLFVCGESLTQRLTCSRLLKGGAYSSHHDHRMVMALKVAELGADGPIVIDDTECVAKSFPGFKL